MTFLIQRPSGGYGDYKGSYIGKGQRLSLGANLAYLSKASIGDYEFDLLAWGVDLFFNTGPVTVEAEYDNYKENNKNGGSEDLVGGGWYAQAGYLLFPVFELTTRYQELDPNDNDDTDKLQWTSVGFNIVYPWT